MTNAPLSDADVKFLFSLHVELDSIERELELAAVIAYFDDAPTSTHPVLNFALRHAPGNVLSMSILRLSEILDTHIERARMHHNLPSLYAGAGRNRRLIDPDFQLVRELRDARIAHGVKLRERGKSAFEQLKSDHGTTIAFLLKLVAKFREQIDQLRGAGVFNLDGLQASVSMSKRFTQDDLRRLVAAANRLVGQQPNTALQQTPQTR